MVKSNKLFKILIMMLVVIFVMGAFGGVVNAQAATGTGTGTGTSSGTSTGTGISSSFIDNIKAEQPTGTDAETKIQNVAGNVLYILQAVGMVAGVAIIAYMGIKYITSSPDGKAEIKKQAFIYIGGAALLMLAPTVAKLVFTAVSK